MLPKRIQKSGKDLCRSSNSDYFGLFLDFRTRLSEITDGPLSSLLHIVMCTTILKQSDQIDNMFTIRYNIIIKFNEPAIHIVLKSQKAD